MCNYPFISIDIICSLLGCTACWVFCEKCERYNYVSLCRVNRQFWITRRDMIGIYLLSVLDLLIILKLVISKIWRKKDFEAKPILMIGFVSKIAVYWRNEASIHPVLHVISCTTCIITFIISSKHIRSVK